jgi:hippurate hydrolase
MAVENWLAKELAALTEFRRDLHMHPELLYDLPRTSAKVAEALRAAGVDEVHEGLGQTGVVGIIRGKVDTKGRMIGLRSDMDALPIHETTGAEHASRTVGKMHACGHDGHTAMLLGAAKGLVESRNFDGAVAVIFQPAEEGGAGAKAMIDDGLFEKFPIQEVYGMHNRPNLPAGRFCIGDGAIMGSVDKIIITIEGTGSHAAQPHNSIDPVTCAAAVVQAAQSIVSRNLDPMHAAVISITSVHGGDAFNVIPTAIIMEGTVRTLDEGVRGMIETRLAQVVKGVAVAFGAEGILEYQRLYPVTVNAAVGVERSVAAAIAVVGAQNVDTGVVANLGGEDFSFMLNERPGAMINIGNGPSAALHHPAYDFNDEIIPYGVSYWMELARQRLPLEG